MFGVFEGRDGERRSAPQPHLVVKGSRRIRAADEAIAIVSACCGRHPTDPNRFSPCWWMLRYGRSVGSIKTCECGCLV
jgi:hypothetical protein